MVVDVLVNDLGTITTEELEEMKGHTNEKLEEALNRSHSIINYPTDRQSRHQSQGE